MAGLVPNRRTRVELERANADLLEKHKQHLRLWIARNSAKSERDLTQDQSSTEDLDLRNNLKRA